MPVMRAHTGGRAKRLHMAALKAHAFLGELVEVRRLRAFAPIRCDGLVTEVISHDEDDVRLTSLNGERGKSVQRAGRRCMRRKIGISVNPSASDESL